jgi:hypothetical protein
MARHPLHTGTVVLTLALGIGAYVAMFAVVDAVLLAPLPYRHADALVMVNPLSDSRYSPPTGADWPLNHSPPTRPLIGP